MTTKLVEQVLMKLDYVYPNEFKLTELEVEDRGQNGIPFGRARRESLSRVSREERSPEIPVSFHSSGSTSNQWRKLKNPWFPGRTSFRSAGKKKRFFAGPTCISYLAEEASDWSEFLPSWDSMDQDLLLLYGQYRSTLVDHMDVENLQPICEVEKVQIAGTTYDVLSIVGRARQQSLVILWILEGAEEGRISKSTGLDKSVFEEIVDAYQQRGIAAHIKRRNLHSSEVRTFLNKKMQMVMRMMTRIYLFLSSFITRFYSLSLVMIRAKFTGEVLIRFFLICITILWVCFSLIIVAECAGPPIDLELRLSVGGAVEPEPAAEAGLEGPPMPTPEVIQAEVARASNPDFWSRVMKGEGPFAPLISESSRYRDLTRMWESGLRQADPDYLSYLVQVDCAVESSLRMDGYSEESIMETRDYWRRTGFSSPHNGELLRRRHLKELLSRPDAVRNSGMYRRILRETKPWGSIKLRW